MRLTMIGQMAGSPFAALDLVVHLLISAFIGATFALLFGSRINAKAGPWIWAAVWNIWWILGPLTLMPVMMGMGVAWTIDLLLWYRKSFSQVRRRPRLRFVVKTR
jgi:hypothetical protein